MSKKKKSRKAPYRDLPAGPHKAFLDAGCHILYGGGKLQPYTPSRVVAAQAMGLLYPKIGVEGHAQLKKTGLYPGELKDIIIVLWLCQLKTKEEVSEALMDPIAAYAEAEKWASKRGLCDMTSDAFGYALLMFQMIMSEIGVSKTTPVTSAGGSSRAGDNDEEGPDPND